jgi:hypothetical protein
MKFVTGFFPSIFVVDVGQGRSFGNRSFKFLSKTGFQMN